MFRISLSRSAEYKVLIAVFFSVKRKSPSVLLSHHLFLFFFADFSESRGRKMEIASVHVISDHVMNNEDDLS